MKIEPLHPNHFDYEPPGEPSNGPDGRASRKARFELIPFDKIAFDTAPAYLIKMIIPRIGLCVVWGPPKCGKSFLVFDMLTHVALGWKYRGRRVQQGAIVYCALEGCAAFKNRVEAFRLARLADNASEVPFHLTSPMSLVALNRSLAGSESDDRDMAAYVKAADAIRDAFNCAVIIVHHCGHEGTRPQAIRPLWAHSMHKPPSNAMPQTISSPR
jgi:hypothetical protein